MSAAAKSTQFYPLSVTAIRQETRDAVVVTLAASPANQSLFDFIPGQYLTFEQDLNGESVRRTYSICAAPSEDRLQVAIKHVPGGRFSSWANSQLAVGDVVSVMPPQGTFYQPSTDDEQRAAPGAAAPHLLFVACGSGITPVISIMKATLTASANASVTLLYGNRSSNSIMFREELEALKDRYLTRVNLVHVLTRETQEIDLFNGRLNEEKFDALFRQWIDVGSIDKAYLCGPQDVMAAARVTLMKYGLADRQIRREHFLTNVARKPSQRSFKPSGDTAVDGEVDVSVVLHGNTRKFKMPSRGKSVLESALAEGMDVPFSCRGGACSTCRALLVEGDVEMDTNYVLEDYEVRRGYILTCQSYPLTNSIKVDYDR